jgi:hypothetical protein
MLLGPLASSALRPEHSNRFDFTFVSGVEDR